MIPINPSANCEDWIYYPNESCIQILGSVFGIHAQLPNVQCPCTMTMPMSGLTRHQPFPLPVFRLPTSAWGMTWVTDLKAEGGPTPLVSREPMVAERDERGGIRKGSGRCIRSTMKISV